ncbi:DNA-directed RNA polymerase subunit beta' [Patescibacteria group bacterium]|nr:DNA-directed RNA polymerase subunit beta' [Patescibacteria group bacterium]
MQTSETTTQLQQDKSVSIRLASPETIRSWSHGEVAKPETINYRTGRSERHGLFDERIFGPEKDYECYCGKYKGIRYRDIVCEKCGVEVTRSIVRRSRMGHIDLASPVAHIWFLRGIPSRMGLILDIPVSKLEKVIYFASYIITDVDEEAKAKVLQELQREYKAKQKSLESKEDKEKLKDLFDTAKKQIQDIELHKVISEDEYNLFSLKFGSIFEAGIGAEAIHYIFTKLDLTAIEAELEKETHATRSVAKRVKVEKRLSLIRSLNRQDTKPEWMFLEVIPVIPPALRPMVALEGGRYATSDVNDLYRRVINRNNRLKKLLSIGAPDVILRNEKRILQEAVDSLIDNSIRKHSGTIAKSSSQKRNLKSLSDSLKGKQGLFRQNLLGKRVDYSGRSVIVVGPKLGMNQCGLPKNMALELFRPFVIAKVIEREMAFNVRGAGKLLEQPTDDIWEILEEVIQGKYVLLNRAPTLHRLSIRAFQPILIEGKAIQLHPLSCAGFNADFDGDQMAVHVPLSEEAQFEAQELMASGKNLLSPSSGNPIVSPSQDMVLGVYWMTKAIDGAKGEGKMFSSPNEAISAYDFEKVDFRAKIYVMPTDSERYHEFDGKPFETTVGRLLFNSIMPKDFGYLNQDIKKKDISKIIARLIEKYGIDETAPVLDKIKNFGFKYVTFSGSTFAYSDALVPEAKQDIIEEGRKQSLEIQNQYDEGLISDGERYRKTIELWESVKVDVEKVIGENLSSSESIYDMVTSGARGTTSNMLQMAGMKGVIVNASGRAIDFPILHSFKEGLTPIEYFITTHGSRKGLTDTALKTASAGYLTRRLHDVAQDVVVTEEDCGTKDCNIAREENFDGIIKSLEDNLVGRVVAQTVKDANGNILYKRNDLLERDDAKAIVAAGITEVPIRTPIKCSSLHGICQKCYGLDLGRNELVKVGEAVGTIASQSIGEPGTQLTLRTFHAGGVTGQDITTGLPRIEELFEKRSNIKSPAVISKTDGVVASVTTKDGTKIIEVLSDAEVLINKKKTKTVEYEVDRRRTPLVKAGDRVAVGDLLTDGSALIDKLFKIAGADRAQAYVVSEVARVYELNSAPVAKKHIEIITRLMFSRRKIVHPGDTKFSTGDVVEHIELVQENERVEAEGKLRAKGTVVVRGISEVALSTKSWLSSASFQHTTRILVSAAASAEKDELRGLKENVIVGNLIPAGTGFRTDFIPFDTMPSRQRQEELEELEAELSEDIPIA